MPVWAVTGKLGGGKTLYAVSQARERLLKAHRVAANFDIFAESFAHPWRDESDIQLLRIPDSPALRDLQAIGIGNPTTDETKNGLLILDECGAILNARTYNQKGRDELIKWFLHSRKLGWDVVFIVQNVALIDKQIREALIEYGVTVRRMDRLNIPGLSAIGIKLKLPRVHVAVTRYGLDRNAVIADRDFFRGSDLFEAYSTRQLIDLDHEVGAIDLVIHEGASCVLPPWHLKGRFMSKFALVKPYARSALVAGLVIGSVAITAAGWVAGYRKQESVKTAAATENAIEDLVGVVRAPTGTLSFLDKTGHVHQTFDVTVVGGDYYVKLEDGYSHVLHTH
ncbi:P-loop NTPase family protein [Chitinimonas naiadis]